MAIGPTTKKTGSWILYFTKPSFSYPPVNIIFYFDAVRFVFAMILSARIVYSYTDREEIFVGVGRRFCCPLCV